MKFKVEQSMFLRISQKLKNKKLIFNILNNTYIFSKLLSTKLPLRWDAFKNGIWLSLITREISLSVNPVDTPCIAFLLTIVEKW